MITKALETQALNSHTDEKTYEEHVGELEMKLECITQKEKVSEATVSKLRKANENLSAELEDLRAAIEKVGFVRNVTRNCCFYPSLLCV